VAYELLSTVEGNAPVRQDHGKRVPNDWDWSYRVGFPKKDKKKRDLRGDRHA
jgi:hypothetical protein